MKKIYKWDKKDLINQFFNLKKEMKNNNFSSEQIVMQEFYLNNILEMLKPTNPFSHPYLLLSNKSIKEHVKSVFNDYLTEFQNDIIKKNIEITNINNDLDYTDVLNKFIPLNIQIDLIKKYFSKTPQLTSAHDKLFNPNYNLLNITNIIDDNSFNIIKKNGYITNKNNQTIEGFTSLCHEVGHYDEFIVTNGLLDKKIYTYNEFNLMNYYEIYSIFYELISILLLKENGYLNGEEFLSCLEFVRETNTYNIEYLLFSKSILTNPKNINDIRFLKCDLIDLSMYYYSYIIAITLFEKYLIDPEKTDYQINYLIKNISPNNERKLLKYCDIDIYNSEKIKNHIEKVKKKNS